MLAKRIIPCLDIKNGRTVKGVQFENIRDAGDPAELASFYSEQGADELVFLDITATIERRKTLYPLVKRLASQIDIPFTVGGGISDLNDISRLLQNGADKVSMNTAAYRHPPLIRKAAMEFGSQCVVIAIDVKKAEDGQWYVHLKGGTEKTDTPAMEWARTVVALGAGEILLTSMNNDGTKNGFALNITREMACELPIPVIASGGAGGMEHFYDVFHFAKADAALAAGVFHFKEMGIPELKNYLFDKGIPIRKYNP